MRDIEYGVAGERCPFKGCVCEGAIACPPGWPCFVDKSGDVILILEYDDAGRNPLIDLYLSIDSDSRSLGRPPSAQADLEGWLTVLLENGTNYIAYHGSTVVGHSTYSPGFGHPPELITFVHPDYRDRGIGTELSRHCIENANDQNDGLILNVGRSNQRATHVGKKLGFFTADVDQFPTRMRLRFDNDQRTSDA